MNIIPLGHWQDDADILAAERAAREESQHSMALIVWLLAGALTTVACGCGFLLGLAGQRLVSWFLNY